MRNRLRSVMSAGCATQPVALLVLLSFVLLLGCAAPAPPPAPSLTGPASSEFYQGEIVDTTTGRPVSFDEVVQQALLHDVLYLGEEHHNRSHVETAVRLLDRLAAAGRRPVLAMEMFGWDGQAVLQDYLAGAFANRQSFLDAVRWQANWGGPFEDYEPLVEWAKRHQSTLQALNPPKTLVRLVARQGLEHALRDGEMVQWAMRDEDIVDDPPYRERILLQLRACHDGGTDEQFRTMYEASMFRDEGMAKTIAELVRRNRTALQPASGPILSYTGGGHVQYNLPLSKRVARRLGGSVRQMSLYLTSYESDRKEDVRDMIQGRIADYVWLTPVGSLGAPRRCR